MTPLERFILDALAAVDEPTLRWEFSAEDLCSLARERPYNDAMRVRYPRFPAPPKTRPSLWEVERALQSLHRSCKATWHDVRLWRVARPYEAPAIRQQLRREAEG